MPPYLQSPRVDHFNHHASQRMDGDKLLALGGVLAAGLLIRGIRESRQQEPDRPRRPDGYRGPDARPGIDSRGRTDIAQRSRQDPALQRGEAPVYDSQNPYFQRRDGTVYQEKPTAPVQTAQRVTSDDKIAGIDRGKALLAQSDDQGLTPETRGQAYASITGRAAKEGEVLSRDHLNDLANYRKDMYLTIFSDENAGEGADVLKEKLRDPQISTQLINQWRSDVKATGQNPASSDYEGEAETILHRLSEAAQDPELVDQIKNAKNFEDLKKIAGVESNSPQVSGNLNAEGSHGITSGEDGPENRGPLGADGYPLPPPPPVDTVKAKPAEPAGVSKVSTQTGLISAEPSKAPGLDTAKFPSGAQDGTAMLNRYSADGLRMMKFGQGEDATYAAFDKNGKLVGGLSVQDEGATKLASIGQEDTIARIQKSGVTFAQAEEKYQKINGITSTVVQERQAAETPKLENAVYVRPAVTPDIPKAIT